MTVLKGRGGKDKSNGRRIASGPSRIGFLIGAGSVLDLFGCSSLHGGYSPAKTDVQALRDDYLTLGGDFWRAIERFEREQADQQPEQARLFDPDEPHESS